jgi:uncharacterized protein
MKFLIVLVALVVLVWLLLGSARRRTKGPRRQAANAPPPATAVEGMVACVHCGVHLPSSQALTVRGQPYCSAAHRDAGPRAP